MVKRRMSVCTIAQVEPSQEALASFQPLVGILCGQDNLPEEKYLCLTYL